MGTHGQESREFKFKIMELHFQNGIPVKVLSEKFGIPEPTIYTWRNQHGAQGWCTPVHLLSRPPLRRNLKNK